MGRGRARKGRVRGGGQPAAGRPRDAARRHDRVASAAPAGWSPRWSRSCARGAAPGSAGPGVADASAEPFEDDGLSCTPSPSPRRGGRGLLRGLLQRHALAALPRRRRAAGVPPALVGGLRQGQRAVRRRRRRGRRPRARRSGCRTTSSSCVPGRCCASAARTCGSGSSCTSRSRRPSCSCSCPWREQIVEGLLGADLVGFHTPGGARNFRALADPARRRDRRAARSS